MSINYNSADTANTINRAIDNSMGLTTTDQGASSAGLIIKEDLQPVVQCTNGFDYAVTVKEISGVPPLSFHSMGQMLQWSIDGNTDSGDSVGDKTKNLLNPSQIIFSYQYDAVQQILVPSDIFDFSGYIPITTDIYLRIYNNTAVGNYCVIFDENKDFIRLMSPGEGNAIVITDVNDKYIGFNISKSFDINEYMFAKTSTVIPYEPYGYDVPIVVNNTDTYHCYITDVLRKSDGETPVYDTMSSDGTIIRRVDTDGTALEEPITETYTAPSVEVPWGNNTVDVDTTVSPSSMYIKYKDN